MQSLVMNDVAWVFLLKRLTAPASKDDCCNRNIKPKLARAGLAWANFLVIRRTHSTLTGGLGHRRQTRSVGRHTLGTSQNAYSKSPVTGRLSTVNPLERKLLIRCMKHALRCGFVSR
jgi:hypothetical protein